MKHAWNSDSMDATDNISALLEDKQLQVTQALEGETNQVEDGMLSQNHSSSSTNPTVAYASATRENENAVEQTMTQSLSELDVESREIVSSKDLSQLGTQCSEVGEEAAEDVSILGGASQELVDTVSTDGMVKTTGMQTSCFEEKVDGSHDLDSSGNFNASLHSDKSVEAADGIINKSNDVVEERGPLIKPHENVLSLAVPDALPLEENSEIAVEDFDHKEGKFNIEKAPDTISEIERLEHGKAYAVEEKCSSTDFAETGESKDACSLKDVSNMGEMAVPSPTWAEPAVDDTAPQVKELITAHDSNDIGYDEKVKVEDAALNEVRIGEEVNDPVSPEIAPLCGLTVAESDDKNDDLFDLERNDDQGNIDNILGSGNVAVVHSQPDSLLTSPGVSEIESADDNRGCGECIHNDNGDAAVKIDDSNLKMTKQAGSSSPNSAAIEDSCSEKSVDHASGVTKRERIILIRKIKGERITTQQTPGSAVDITESSSEANWGSVSGTLRRHLPLSHPQRAISDQNVEAADGIINKSNDVVQERGPRIESHDNVLSLAVPDAEHSEITVEEFDHQGGEFNIVKAPDTISEIETKTMLTQEIEQHKSLVEPKTVEELRQSTLDMQVPIADISEYRSGLITSHDSNAVDCHAKVKVEDTVLNVNEASIGEQVNNPTSPEIALRSGLTESDNKNDDLSALERNDDQGKLDNILGSGNEAVVHSQPDDLLTSPGVSEIQSADDNGGLGECINNDNSDAAVKMEGSNLKLSKEAGSSFPNSAAIEDSCSEKSANNASGVIEGDRITTQNAPVSAVEANLGSASGSRRRPISQQQQAIRSYLRMGPSSSSPLSSHLLRFRGERGGDGPGGTITLELYHRRVRQRMGSFGLLRTSASFEPAGEFDIDTTSIRSWLELEQRAVKLAESVEGAGVPSRIWTGQSISMKGMTST